MGAERPSVWLICPAYRRYAVTRLALSQRAHMAGVLAERGIDCHTVVIADDDNLDIAREFGCATVEMPNDWGLGAKFNAGFQHAAMQGADWFVHIGSDDWLHPDAVVLDRERITAGRQIAFVDLVRGRMRRAQLTGPTGVIPWIIPRSVLLPAAFAPIPPHRRQGMDGYLVRGVRRAGATVRFSFCDPHPLGRVDFKSATNVNPYERVSQAFGSGAEDPDPWPLLANHYPAELVERGRATHEEMSGCRS